MSTLFLAAHISPPSRPMLSSVLAKAAPALKLNEHIETDGATVFRHACRMGLEGIVSKRKDLPYCSGRQAIGSK